MFFLLYSTCNDYPFCKLVISYSLWSLPCSSWCITGIPFTYLLLVILLDSHLPDICYTPDLDFHSTVNPGNDILHYVLIIINAQLIDLVTLWENVWWNETFIVGSSCIVRMHLPIYVLAYHYWVLSSTFGLYETSDLWLWS